VSLPEQLNKLVQSATGPSPWFWETFPEVRGKGTRRYRWHIHGQDKGLQNLVTLHGEGEPERPRLALNTHCRAFSMGTRAVSEKLYPIEIVPGRCSLMVATADGLRLRNTPSREPLATDAGGGVLPLPRK
jgi:hypothetical protein